MMTAKYELVIFDWDGTLMDSIDRIVSSMQAAAIAVGIEKPSSADTKSIIGLSLPIAIKTLFPLINTTQLAKVEECYRQQYVELNNTPTPMFTGAIALLTALDNHGIKIAIATGKSRAGLNKVFQSTALAHYFSTSRCADECASKPDPQMLAEITTELNIDIKNTIYVGDTVFDMKMANSIEMASVGVTMGVNTALELNQYKPAAIFDDLKSLQQFLLPTIEH